MTYQIPFCLTCNLPCSSEVKTGLSCRCKTSKGTEWREVVSVWKEEPPTVTVVSELRAVFLARWRFANPVARQEHMEDMDDLIAAAHREGLREAADLVSHMAANSSDLTRAACSVVAEALRERSYQEGP